MNRIALGTAQLGMPYGIANQSGQVSGLAAAEMLRLAYSSGIDTLDTAIAYGDSETCLGKIGTEGFKLVTKLPPVPPECQNVREWINSQISGSLTRLRVASIYGLLLHSPRQLLEAGGNAIYEELRGLQHSGLIEKLGISVYSPAELDSLLSKFRFDLIQAPFNLVDQRLLNTGWLRRLKGEQIEVHTRSTFLQGLLLMQAADMPRVFEVWDTLWRTWDAWQRYNRVSALQTCLAYPLSFPEIDRVVVGADSAIQLQQIVNAASETRSLEFPDLSCEDERLINPSNWVAI